VCQSSEDVDCFRDHVKHGHLGFRLRYIGARSLIVYPYVFVAGPNKHDLFPCVNDQRKFQHSTRNPKCHLKQLLVVFVTLYITEWAPKCKGCSGTSSNIS
jgi:hypothetical protein